MKTVELDVKYHKGDGTFSHQHKSKLQKTRYFCPICGGRGVWVDVYGGDYYVGPNWYCPSCSSVFTMPSEELYATEDIKDKRIRSSQEQQVLEAIRDVL